MTWKKIALLACLMTALIGCLYLLRSSQVEPVLSARPAVDREELNRLIDLFSKRTEASSNPTDTAFLGGLLLQRGGLDQSLSDLELARQHLLVAAQVYPDVITLTNLAQADLSLHSFGEAVRLAQDVTTVDPSNAGARSVLIDAQLALGQYQEAADNLDLLGRQLQNDPAVLVRRAQLLFLTGDGRAAAEHGDLAAEAAKSLPNAEQAFYLAASGRLWFEQGDYRKAHSLSREAVALDPDASGAHLELARAQAALGDLNHALESAERAVNLVPDPAALTFYGDLLTAAGSSQAADQYRAVLAINQLGLDAYRRGVAASLAERGEEPELALKLTQAEIALRQDPTTWDVRAMALLAVGDIDAAAAASKKALGPADARIWYHAGLISFHAGELGEAETYLTKALDLNPEFHPVLAGRARELLAQIRS